MPSLSWLRGVLHTLTVEVYGADRGGRRSGSYRTGSESWIKGGGSLFAAAAGAAGSHGDRWPCSSPTATPWEVAELDKQQRAGGRPPPGLGRPGGRAGGAREQEEEPWSPAAASASGTFSHRGCSEPRAGEVSDPSSESPPGCQLSPALGPATR